MKRVIVKLFGLTAASVGASEKRLKQAGLAYEKIYLHPFSHATSPAASLRGNFSTS